MSWHHTFTADLDLDMRAYVPAFAELGGLLPEQVTLTNIGELRRATGLDWEPATEPQYRVRVLGPGQETVEQVPGLKYITREVGGPVLGSMKESYHLFHNADLFGIAETIGIAALESGQPVRFISGGEIDGGRRVYLQAELGNVDFKGDPSPHVRYMTLLSSHNGSGAVKVLGTDGRWSCTNMLRAVEMQAAASGAAFSFRHTAKLSKRLADSRKAIVAAIGHLDLVRERSGDLLGTPVTARLASSYLREFALSMVVAKGNPARHVQAAESPHRELAIGRVEAEVTRLFESPTCDGIRGVAYGPFAAAVEYLDNVRPATSAGTRFDRTMVNTERGKVIAYDLTRRLF